jgi:hypothetical protein
MTAKGLSLVPVPCSTRVKLVLPFKYALVENKEAAGVGHFCRVKPQELKLASNRLKYFARDTAQVMFERAAWFKWQGYFPAPSQPQFEGKNGIDFAPITVGLLEAPEIVLFEAPGIERNATSSAGSMNIGMFIVEFVLLGKEGEEPSQDSLNSWLEFVERIRFWQPKFEGFTWPELFHWNPESMCKKTGFEQFQSWLNQPLKIGNGSFKLFPSEWNTAAEKDASVVPDKKIPTGDNHFPGKCPSWACYADNRCYVWHLLVTSVGPDLTVPKHQNASLWAKMLNVDSVSTASLTSLEASEFELEWAAKRTYKRWVHARNAYGFSYHSGMAWMGSASWGANHFQDLYFDAALLLLYTRVALFEFSARVSELGIEHAKDRDNKEFLKKYQNLRNDFLLFSNLYQYPLITNQQQGIEMYALMREQMDVADLFTEIERDIETAHEQFNLQEAFNVANRTERLQTLATFFLPFSLAFAWFAIENKPYPKRLDEKFCWLYEPNCVMGLFWPETGDFWLSFFVGWIFALLLLLPRIRTKNLKKYWPVKQ